MHTGYQQPQGAGAGRGAGRGGGAIGVGEDRTGSGGQLWNLVSKGHEEALAKSPIATLSLCPPAPPPQHSQNQLEEVRLEYKEVTSYFLNTKLSSGIGPAGPQYTGPGQGQEVTSFVLNTNPGSGTGPGPQYTEPGRPQYTGPGQEQQVTSYFLNANPPSKLTTHTAHASSSTSPTSKFNLAALAPLALLPHSASGSSLNEGLPPPQVCLVDN